MYRSVELYNKPEEKVTDLHYSEMTSFQHAFLCGLIKENRPKKIVEIGVSAGGTTGVIFYCLEMLGIKAEMYSVDLSEKWYRNMKYETGFFAKQILRNYENRGDIKHQFLLGKAIPFFLEQIGKDIDFLILDTVHSLPGELLDFIICLPYLKNGCIVVMHDTIENHNTCTDIEIATKLLFDTVTATDKYLMWEDGNNVVSYPNIAAFKIEEETRVQIRDVFSTLTFTWGYFLNDFEKQKYRESIVQNYGEKYLQLFDKIETLQRHTCLQKRITEHYGKDSNYLKWKWQNNKRVFLYGAGDYGNIYCEWGRLNNLEISGFVISDDQDKVTDRYKEIPLYHLSELPYSPEECAIIVAVDRLYQSLVLQNLKRKGYHNIL